MLACRGAAVLSHGSAAALWRLGTATDGAVHVTVASRARRSPDGITVHTSRALPPNEVTHRDGIPVTAPVRTLMDLAAQHARRPLERTLDAAARLRLVERQELEAIVAAQPGHHGAARLAVILADHQLGSTFTRSDLEERMFAICRQSRLPQPRTNTSVEGEVDFLWPAERLVVETDGYASHGTREAFERDRDRDARLALAGYLVLRFSYRRITREPQVVASLLSSPPAPVMAALRATVHHSGPEARYARV